MIHAKRTWLKPKRTLSWRRQWRRLNKKREVIFQANWIYCTFSFRQFTDKIEDARAKAAIKAQIEADKKARAEKSAREKALRDGQPIQDSPSTTAAPKPANSAPVSGVAGKDFKETRLQIRMASGGQPYTTTLPSDSSGFPSFLNTQFIMMRNCCTIFSIAWSCRIFGRSTIICGCGDGFFLTTFSKASRILSKFQWLLTSLWFFCRKTFSQQDFSRTLRDLGLTPSAVRI